MWEDDDECGRTPPQVLAGSGAFEARDFILLYSAIQWDWLPSSSSAAASLLIRTGIRGEEIIVCVAQGTRNRSRSSSRAAESNHWMAGVNDAMLDGG